MMLALQALILAVGQPVDEPIRWKYCPNGAQYRYDKDCPSTGPDPAYVYFDRNDAALSERATQLLDYLASTMRTVRAAGIDDAVLFIEAHADRSEADGPDIALSRQRATAVRLYLISRGCPPDALRVLAVGDARPAVNSANGGDEADNRRVVIWNLRM